MLKLSMIYACQTGRRQGCIACVTRIFVTSTPSIAFKRGSCTLKLSFRLAVPFRHFRHVSFQSIVLRGRASVGFHLGSFQRGHGHLVVCVGTGVISHLTGRCYSYLAAIVINILYLLLLEMHLATSGSPGGTGALGSEGFHGSGGSSGTGGRRLRSRCGLSYSRCSCHASCHSLTGSNLSTRRFGFFGSTFTCHTRFFWRG